MKNGCATRKRYKRVPPEGGWGWLICIGMALPFISALASMTTFGLVFGEFLKELGEESSAVALITSSFFSAMSFAGLFANSLIKKFSLRTIGLVGGIMYFTGSAMQVFAHSTVQLLIAFSILQGAAFGLIVPTSYTTFNNYFIEKRLQMMSVAQTFIGLGTMAYPIVIQKLLEMYGFRGALAVLTAINGHAILGMLAMHPVEWHMKKVEIEDEEMSVLKEGICESSEQDEFLSDKNPKDQLSEHRKITGDRFKQLKDEESNRLSRRASSIASLGNWTGPVLVSDVSERDPRKNKKWQVLVDFLDLTLLKEPVYVNIVIGMSMVLYSDVAFFTFQPLYLFDLGFSKPDTATIIAIGAAADLASRVFLAAASTFVTVPSRYIYLGGALFTIVARFAFLHVFDFTGMAIITAVMGFLRTWVHVPLPLVFAEYLSKERFPSGYGLFMFLQGNITFLIGPVVGYIRDATRSYEITFHCLNFFMGLCAFPWLIEILYLKWKKWKK